MPDVEGLAHQVDPLSRRGFFMAASAVAAAGYTLAAGPVKGGSYAGSLVRGKEPITLKVSVPAS